MAGRRFARWASLALIGGLLRVVPAYAQTDLDKIIETAAHGNASTQIFLGTNYKHGVLQLPDGSRIERDGTKAEYWLTKAAEQDVPYAQFLLGELYYQGEVVERDEPKAALWLFKVIYHKEQDAKLIVQAQYMMGTMLYRECTGYLTSLTCGSARGGKLLGQNFQSAAAWFQKAASAGHRGARYELASMYEAGHGVAQDFAEAARLYRLVADAGDNEAVGQLGQLYLRTENYVAAHMWFNVGAADGLAWAAERRDKAAKLMTTAQIAEAQRLAREYIAARKK